MLVKEPVLVLGCFVRQGWIFCRNNLSFKALEVSDCNTEVIEYVHVKLHSPNKKTINIVDIYRAPSHGVRARFLPEVEKITLFPVEN